MKKLEFQQPKLLYFENLMALTPRKAQTVDTVSLRSLIAPKDPNAVSFFLSPESALRDWAQTIELKSGDIVGLIAPYPKEFSRVLSSFGATLRLLPKDPEELLRLDFSSLKAVMLSNPNLADSFFYPRGNYKSIFEHLLQFPKLEILSEESLHEFYRHVECPEPGSLSEETHPRLTVLSGVYSFASDTFSWLIRPSRELVRQETSLKAAPVSTHSLLAIREARNFKQFSRRLFVMEHNLIRFAHDLRPALLTGMARVHFWPKPRALYVLIDISKILELRRCSVETWVHDLEQETGIVVEAGSPFGAPHSIRICLAYGFRHLREVTAALTKHLNSALLGE